MIFYSAKNNGFYSKALKRRYENSGSWPDDAVQLTDEEIDNYQGAQPPSGKILGADDSGRPVWVNPPEPTQEEIDAEKAKSEHSWVKSELNAVSIELMYHWTDDHRASHTEQAWKDYAIALRDYTSTDADGNPVVVGESRPSINDYA